MSSIASHPFLAALARCRLFFDGSTGTMLQARGLCPGELPELWNLSRPEEIVALHQSYLAVGANVLTTNTFGANRLHYGTEAGGPSLEEVVTAGVRLARRAIEASGRPRDETFVALDIGPSGKMMAPLGDLAFEAAVELFAEVARIGAAAGADVVLVETMNDAYETKAALLAAKEATALPVIVSNTYDEGQALLSGTPPEAMVAMLEGLHADVISANCGLGPDRLLPVARRLLAAAHVPVLVSPNAGLPQLRDGRPTYPTSPAQFAEQMGQIADLGASLLGGCCGTTPDHIRELVQRVGQRGFVPADRRAAAHDAAAPAPAIITSYARAVPIGLPSSPPVLIGERINPTGRKAFQAALRAGDLSEALAEAASQKADGAQVLDVNMGVPGADEPALLLRAVTELQAITDLPLQIDTSDPAALALALRAYNGKPLVNSVNGKQASLDAVLPLVARYGGALVCLTLDESGIPASPCDRLAIALRIRDAAAEHGIPASELVFDPLAMSAGADPDAPQATLEALSLIRAHGLKTSLGVSNVSFGLPRRPLLNATFLTLAIRAGLDAAILNPHSLPLREALHAASALLRLDPGFAAYVAFAAAHPAPAAAAPPATRPAAASNASAGDVPAAPAAQPPLYAAIVSGLKPQATAEAKAALASRPPLEVINQLIIPALDQVGRDYEQRRAFIPQLMMAAEAAQAAFAVIQSALASSDATPRPRKYPIVLATVRGDIHDIGKNIVRTILENYDYEVIDLGRDVAPEAIVEAARTHHAPLVGLSALMTTTLPAMKETIALLHRELPHVKTCVGGAVLTAEYAAELHADHYAPDAMDSVRYAESLLP
ncbi:MAG: homocysteine S-methyltransferase family protein [Kiritimatiellae bacterium]|nr:homocysteine S-methyltransferase family protein [Kiritimatiellia bacterium]